MVTKRLQKFIDKYGPVAGPKMYRTLQSRAAYIGVSVRLRKTIAGLTGTPIPTRKPVRSTETALRPLLNECETNK